jgi:hypothetical protein
MPQAPGLLTIYTFGIFSVFLYSYQSMCISCYYPQIDQFFFLIVIHVLDRVTYIMLHSGSGWLNELGSWIT